MKNSGVSAGDFVVCGAESGRIVKDGKKEPFATHFPAQSVGFVKSLDDSGFALVDVIGKDADYLLETGKLTRIDPAKTGKGFQKKICNICHVLKKHAEFAPNQRDAKGNITTRPSCRVCRRDIDQQPLTAAAKKKVEKARPKPGTLFQCPICRKRSIAGVTAKIVFDHRHSDGSGREFLCDSCNTGLGRFKNGHDYLQNAASYLKQFEK